MVLLASIAVSVEMQYYVIIDFVLNKWSWGKKLSKNEVERSIDVA